jgi:hypothetical protein
VSTTRENRRRLHFFFLWQPGEENATVALQGLSHLMQQINRTEEIDMFSLPLALFLSVGAIAVFSFVAVAAWSDNRRKEREAYYKAETLKKMVEAHGPGSSSPVELLREEERLAARRRREGQRLGGLITFAVGIGLMIFLKAVDHDGQTYLVGAIPLLVGAALLAYSYLLAPKE